MLVEAWLRETATLARQVAYHYLHQNSNFHTAPCRVPGLGFRVLHDLRSRLKPSGGAEDGTAQLHSASTGL